MNESAYHRVRSVIARALKLDVDRLTEDTRRGELVEWDSLGHLLVMQALEVEFGISLSPEQALDIESVEDAQRMLIANRTADRS